MERGSLRIVACLLCLVGIWIGKGMGLIVPGFIPSTRHSIFEYSPSLVAWKVTAGIGAVGLLLLTVRRKLIANVFPGKRNLEDGTPATTKTEKASPARLAAFKRAIES